MPDKLDIPVLSYDDLRHRARDFLRTYHPAGTIPVPIEEIVELQHKINIIAVPGLERAFDVDGFISSDLQSITVDEFVYWHRPTRYRFTLSHEVAHAVLHRAIYETHLFQRVDEYKQFQRQIGENDREWLEWQAYSFAGLVLVPTEHLRIQYEEAHKAAAAIGLPPEKVGEVAHRFMAEWIGRQFDVSRDVVERRIRYDKL